MLYLTAALSGPRAPQTPAWRDLCLRRKRGKKAPFPPSIPSYWPGARPVYVGKVSLFLLCLLPARTCLLEGNEHLLKRLLCPHHYSSPPPFFNLLATPHGTWNPISPTRDWTRIPALEVWGLHAWTTREVPPIITLETQHRCPECQVPLLSDTVGDMEAEGGRILLKQAS